MGSNNLPFKLVLTSIILTILFTISLCINVIQYNKHYNIINNNLPPITIKDSLQTEINNLSTQNKILYEKVKYYENQIIIKTTEIIKLQNKIKNEQEETQQLVNSVDDWSYNQLAVFFTDRYSGYLQDSIR